MEVSMEDACPSEDSLILEVFHDALPSCCNLGHQYISVPLECSSYGVLVEDFFHALFGCHVAQSFWKEAGFGELIKECLVASTIKVLFAVFCRTTRELFESFCVHLWCL